MAARKRSAKNGELEAAEHIDVDDLHFDHTNPRLAPEGTGDDQDAILRVLWREFSVDEIALSIAENGYFEYEPVFAAREKGRLVVVEGNRRLAAVKLLRSDALRKACGATRLPKLTAGAKKKLASIPVVVCKRNKIWQYLGFRHINGPQAWGSESKSEYIAFVHNTLKVPLPAIARTIGDTHKTVERLYGARMVLEQARRKKVWSKEDRWKKHFSFSHLYTGLGYNGIRAFIGVTDARSVRTDPVPSAKTKNLGDLLVWVFGSKSLDEPPLVKTQNPDLRLLDEVLQETEGVVALRRGLPLRVSLDIARGDERLFREAIQSAKQSVQQALGTVVTGYHGEGDLLDTAEDIFELSEKLYNEMTGIQENPKRRRRATTRTGKKAKRKVTRKKLK